MSTDPTPITDRFFRDFFPKALLLLGIVGVVGVAYLLFRPLRARAPHTETRLGPRPRLVRGYGSDTLAYFALRDDKSFFFCSDGEVLIAYTYLGGFALVSGDPIGRAGLDRCRAGRIHRLLRRPLLAGRVPGRPRFGTAALRVAGLSQLLSRRRGDHPVRHASAWTARHEGHPVGRSPGRQDPPLQADARIRRARRARRASSTDQRAVARQGTRARLHDVAEPGHRRGRPQPEFLLCIALDEDRAARAASCVSCRRTATTSATRST